MNLGESLFNKAQKVQRDRFTIAVSDIIDKLTAVANKGEYSYTHYGRLDADVIAHFKKEGIQIIEEKGTHPMDKISYKITFKR